MKSNFRIRKISEVATIIAGGTPSTKNLDYWDGEIPWITPKDLSTHEGVFINSGQRSITETGLRNSSAKMLPSRSVLYTSRAPIGYVAINEVPVCTNQGFKSLVPKPGFDSLYLYYALRYSKGKVLSLSAGGTFAEISASAMGEVELLVPDIATQKLIGAFGLDLNEKIRVNREIAAALEDIAQAIFESWFVNFDPVRAKASGEQPAGMDYETAALFPDSFQESELGEIPGGWAVRTVADVVDRKKPGKLYDKKSAFAQGTVPILDQGSSGVIGWHDDEPGVQASKDHPYVVFANHTCSLRLISYPFSAIQNVFPILGKDVATIWLFFALQDKQEFDSYKGHWPDLAIKKVVVPPQLLTDQFSKLVNPFLRRVWTLNEQNQVLIEIRDSLLPRLISGELEIPAELFA